MIAIKRSASPRYKKWTEQAANEGRTGFVVDCSKCKEHYVVYYEPAMEEAQARKAFEQQVKREHSINPPHRADGFSIDENFPTPTDELEAK